MKVYYKYIINIFQFLALIMTFIYVIKLSKISSTNPFNVHIIENINNYLSITYKNYVRCDCKGLSFDNIECPEELIKIGCENKYEEDSDFEKLVLEPCSFSNSNSFCYEFYSNFILFRGKNLTNIFNINYDEIHKFSIPTLIVLAILLIVRVIQIPKILNLIDIKIKICNLKKILLLINAILNIVYFILFIFLNHYIESGDIEKYDAFLNCGNVNKNFFEWFSDINQIRESYKGFIVLNIIVQCLNEVENLLKDFENIIGKNQEKKIVNCNDVNTSSEGYNRNDSSVEIFHLNQKNEKKINIIFTYSVRITTGTIISEVENDKDYAGRIGYSITDIAIKVNVDSIKYRVHIKDGDWLDFVTGYDRS